MEIRSHRSVRLDLPRSTVWDALGSVDQYPTWWPWLESFEASRLGVGETWRCTIHPPLPYVVRCAIHIDAIDHARWVAASVTGDISGHAQVELADHAGGTVIRLASWLAPKDGPALLAARFAPPIARWGHDRVLAAAVQQFAATVPQKWGASPGRRR